VTHVARLPAFWRAFWVMTVPLGASRRGWRCARGRGGRR